MKTRLLVLTAVLVLSGCAGTSSSDGPVKGKPVDPQAQAQADLLAEVDGLKSQVQRQAAELEDLSLQLRTFTQGDGSGNTASLPELAKRIQKLEGNLRQMGSQLGVEVDGQQPAANPAAGGDPSAQEPGGPGNPAAASMAPGSTGQPQTAAAQAPAAPPQAPAPAVQAPAPQATPAAGTDPAEALYAKGMQAFQARDYDKASALWGDLAKGYPKHNLASNAYFWIGEAYFQKGDWGQAALNYSNVTEKFPKSNKAPAAMLKMGMAFQKMNKKDAARFELQDLIKKFPDSVEARQAKKLL